MKECETVEACRPCDHEALFEILKDGENIAFACDKHAKLIISEAWGIKVVPIQKTITE